MRHSARGEQRSALRDAVRFTYSSAQALTRAAFTNMDADVLVTSPEWRRKGYGAMALSAHWDARWKLAREDAYVDEGDAVHAAFGERPSYAS